MCAQRAKGGRLAVYKELLKQNEIFPFPLGRYMIGLYYRPWAWIGIN